MSGVNERSTAYITAQLRDRTNQLAVPSAVTYRIDCLTTGAQIKPWTALPPTSSVEIVVAASENAILGGNERERRCVTVIAAYGAGSDDQVTAQFFYDVLDLRFVS